MTEPFNIHCLDNDQIQQMREDIYLGCGYYIVRGFLQPQQVEHMVNFWAKHNNPKVVPRIRKHKDFYKNCPDYSVLQPEMRRHFNFFWNKPLDMFTFDTAWQLQTLRNRIESQPPSFEFLPHTLNFQKEYRATSYRIVETISGGAVNPHVDYAFDHSRIQVSVVLTTAGEDYTSGGFVFYDKFRDGQPHNLSFEENLRAGDLVLFRYGQKHGVEAVTTPPGGRGFVRILMPQESIPIGEGKPVSRLVRKLKAKLHKKKKKGGGAETEELYYDAEQLQMMQLAIKRGFSPSEVFYHKGLWGRFRSQQEWQWNALRRYGLQPEHQFLDIGTGIGRLAMKLVPYLEDDHYCGVDPVAGFVDLSRAYLREVVNTHKTYHIATNHDFGFAQFNRQFDFAMSHSVFTHMTLEQIEQCFEKLKPVMKPGGQLIFTIILGEDREESFVYEGLPMTWSTHRDMSFYEGLAKKYGFKVELLGREDHPSQEVCRATF